MSPNDMQMLIKSLQLLEQEPEIQENSPVVEDTVQSDNRDYLPAIEEFLFNLGPDDVGVEKFGPYTVHFEGFSDYCQQDANDRCYLPKEDPRHLDKYEDIYDEVLRDFINREDGKMPIDSGLTGDEEYPIYYAIFKEEDVVEYVNKDTVTPGFKKEKWIMGGKYKLVATARDRKNDKDAEGLIIRVIDPEDTSAFRPGEVGSVRLIVKGDGSYDDRALSASLLGVDDDHQRKGLASAMYQFARELGNSIIPSNAQTDMGKAFWQGGAGIGKDFPEELPPEPEAKQEPEVEPEVKKPFWKRLFKEDELEEEIAYHGTTDDIAEFYPLTHFGTEKAAKDRMTFKKIKDGKIYKVDLDIKNPLTIKDFPGVHYDRLYAFELRDKKLISQKEMEAITTIEDKAELRKALLAKLKELGFDGFVYKNRYEDRGNLSYVIVDPSQVKVLGVEPAAEEVTEASPNTLKGSFTPDLVESKKWLANMLAKGLKGKNAGTIYVLGSWYGNMGIFLHEADIKFDKLVLVEPNEEWLRQSKKLLDTFNTEGKIVFLNQKAEDVVYEKPGVVINTSCNETGPIFLNKVPDNMLCLLQARNNNENTLFPTEDEEDFVDYFPLSKVYYTGDKYLEDPEINYVRYMKIGRK